MTVLLWFDLGTPSFDNIGEEIVTRSGDQVVTRSPNACLVISRGAYASSFVGWVTLDLNDDFAPTVTLWKKTISALSDQTGTKTISALSDQTGSKTISALSDQTGTKTISALSDQTGNKKITDVSRV